MNEFNMTKPMLSTAVAINIILVLILLLFVFLAVTLLSAGNYKLSIDENTLMIKSLMFNTNIYLSDIDKENIKVIDMNDDSIKINMRTNGIGLPGLKIGWFSGNGIKYKMYVTDKSEVVEIPTMKNYTILFSSKDSKRIVKIINGK